MTIDTTMFTPSPAMTFTARGIEDARLARQDSFQGVISRASGTLDREARAREAAEQLVATTFVEPLLKQVREAHKPAPPFTPGPGEKQFRALMDAELAQRIVHASQWPLVERLASDLLKRTQQA